MNEKTKKILRSIETSFATEIYPGDMQIVYNISGEHLECNEVWAAFKGMKNTVSEKLFSHIEYSNGSCIFFYRMSHMYITFRCFFMQYSLIGTALIFS